MKRRQALCAVLLLLALTGEAGGKEAARAGWCANLSGIRIPASRAAGMVAGRRFVCESAEYDPAAFQLRLYRGGRFNPDLAVQVSLWNQTGGAGLEGRVCSVKAGEDTDRTSVSVSVGVRRESRSPTQWNEYYRGYSLILRLGRARNGRLPGAIYLCLPDADKSYVAGAFSALVLKTGTETP